MFRTLLFLGLFIAQSVNLSAQLNPYKLRIGAGIGYSNYYGDLSNYRYGKFPDWHSLGETYSYNANYNQSPSISLSIEQRINASWGLLLNGGQYTLSMSDRFVDTNDALKIDGPNFNRALNFKTRVRDLGLGFVFRSDNGKILRENALIAPYLSVHGGWLQFKPKGDLLDKDGNQYDYSQNELITDGNFETDLGKLQASSNNGYDENAFYLAAGIGIRFRLTKQIELYFQSDVKRTNTDYIDDVDGSYRTSYVDEFQKYAAYPGVALSPSDKMIRGDAQNNRDWFFTHQFGLKLSFLPSRTAFRANTINPSSTIIRAITEIKIEYEGTDSSNNTASSETIKNNSDFNKEKVLAPERKALPIESKVQEIPAQIESRTNADSTLTFSALNSRISETEQKRDSVTIWQYPFRQSDPEIVYVQEKETIYSRYNQNNLREQSDPQINAQYVAASPESQVANSNILYPLPYYSRPSAVNQAAYVTAPIGMDSTMIADSTALVQLDTVEMNSISKGFKAIPRQGIAGQKYKFETPANLQGINSQLLNSNESKAALIENGLYAEIYFESNQSILSENETLKLAALVKMLNQTPKAIILVKGFADNTGSTSYNLKLIEKRAAVVEESLLSRFGVDKDRIERQPGALLIRGVQRSSRPEDRKVEVQVFY